MKEVIVNLLLQASEFYNNLINFLPYPISPIFNLMVLTFGIFIYIFFIWNFHRFVSSKDFLGLNLNKKIKAEKDSKSKLLSRLLFFVEYLILSPFIIFFWFAIFTFFLIIITEGYNLQELLIISAVIVAVIRMSSYYNENLSKDIAKLIPLTLLAISITKSNFISIDKIVNHISEISLLFGEILIYLSFIFALEIILRFFELIFSLFDIDK